MRITGGTGKGRTLKVPAGSRIRPTADKVKQALFNILGDKVQDALFLDLYCGTGGVGIEAERAFFVDDARQSLQVTRQNIEQCGFEARATIVPAKAGSFLKKAPREFDIVFLDPPYSLDQDQLLTMVAESEILKQNSVIVSEHFKKQKSPERAGRLSLYREAVYGDTVLAFYKIGLAAPGGEGGNSDVSSYPGHAGNSLQRKEIV